MSFWDWQTTQTFDSKTGQWVNTGSTNPNVAIGSVVNAAPQGHIECLGDGPSGPIRFLCEEYVGCCENQCCPKDRYWLPFVIGLIVFTILVALVAGITVCLCYSRRKNRPQSQGQGYYSGASHIDDYPAQPNAPAGAMSVISQPPGSTGYIYEPLSGLKY